MSTKVSKKARVGMWLGLRERSGAIRIPTKSEPVGIQGGLRERSGAIRTIPLNKRRLEWECWLIILNGAAI